MRIRLEHALLLMKSQSSGISGRPGEKNEL